MAKGGAPLSAVPGKALRRGLKEYGRGKKTADIAEDLEGKAEDPKALAVWIRRRSLGQAEFQQHQRSARKK